MEINVINFETSNYFKYYNRIKEILESDYYKNKIEEPTRIECVSPEYNILNYSKYNYMNMAATSNPFQSIMFYWLDQSSSNYLDEIVLSKPFPSTTGINIVKPQKKILFMQKRADLYTYNFTNDFIWKNDKLLNSGVFGGDQEVIGIIADKIENVFVEDMLNNNNVNHDSVAMTLLRNKSQYNELLFALCDNTHPMFLLKILSA
jgi:methylglyoxal synthase